MIRPVYSWLGAGVVFAALGIAGAVAAHEPLADYPLASSAVAPQLAQSFPVIDFPPGDGTFAGTGIATGSKFTAGRQASAMVSFNNASSSFSFSIVAGGDTVLYQGTVVRRSASRLGVNGLVLETRVDSFMSSVVEGVVFDAEGTCRIEVFNSQVVTSTCNITAPAPGNWEGRIGLSTEFQGGEAPTARDGTFPGRGIATGSKFMIGRQANAMLSANSANNFSLSLDAIGGDNLDMIYQGTITRRSAGSRGVNGFVLETRVNSFASSLGDGQVFDASGTCRIEVFDALVVSSICHVTAPAFPADLTVVGLSTEFRGMEQF